MNTSFQALSTISSPIYRATISPWPLHAYRRALLFLRRAIGIQTMSEKESIFFTESYAGSRQQRRYTLELLKEADNSYRLVQRRYNQDLNVLDEETHTLAGSKDELKSMNLGNSRLVKQLRRSEWWESDES